MIVNSNGLQCKVVMITNMEEIEEVKKLNAVVTDEYLKQKVPAKNYVKKDIIFNIRNLKDDLICFYKNHLGFIIIERRNGLVSVINDEEDIWDDILNLCI
jgi:hypothetical protein